MEIIELYIVCNNHFKILQNIPKNQFPILKRLCEEADKGCLNRYISAIKYVYKIDYSSYELYIAIGHLYSQTWK